jgi:hypothetical protein
MSTVSMSLRCKNCGHSVFNDVKPLVSPVPSLLGTHAWPASAETAVVRSVLLEADAELLAFDHEIVVLATVLEQRRQSRRALHKFRNAHANLLSPINRLPPELLTEIFLLWTREASDVSVIAAVCNRWRKLALSTPQLWSTIRIGLHKENSHSQAKIVQTWLKRSAMCPLSLTLEQEVGDGSDSHPVINVIIPHSHRLEYLSISIYGDMIRALSPLKSQLPALKTLDLWVMSYTVLDGSPYDIFVDAPQLRILDTNVPSRTMGMGYPFAQLTQCCISRLCPSECLQVLRIARNITTCTFREMMFLDGSAGNPRLPVVSHLHTLSIGFAEEGLGEFFSSLWLPAVREISIDLDYHAPWPHTEFLSLVSPSSHQLEKLIFQNTRNMSSEHLICCLEAIPSLQELRCGDFDHGPGGPYWSTTSHLVNDAVLRKLTHQPGSEGQLPLVPSLHTFRYVGHNTFEDQSLLDMIESRWDRELPKGLGRLRAVFVSLSHDLAPETLARAKAWKEQGLDILLQSRL